MFPPFDWQTDYAAHLDNQALSEELRLADLAEDARSFGAVPEPRLTAAQLTRLETYYNARHTAQKAAKCKA